MVHVVCHLFFVGSLFYGFLGVTILYVRNDVFLCGKLLTMIRLLSFPPESNGCLFASIFVITIIFLVYFASPFYFFLSFSFSSLDTLRISCLEYSDVNFSLFLASFW